MRSITTTEQGFTLVEILVSIVILSFGLLGVVGLQVASLKSNREARLQSTGVRFAEEIAEMIRGNHIISSKTSAADNPYLISYISTTTTAAPSCGIPGQNKCLTPTEIATRDVAEWWARLNNPLAGGISGARVAICFDSTPYDKNGLPKWDCSNTGSTLAIKVGWTRNNPFSEANDADITPPNTGNTDAFDKALHPAIVIPVTPGVL